VRRLALLPLLLPAVALPSTAQEQPAVQLLLTEQTSFATPEDPLRVAVRAVNETETEYTELSLAVTVWSAVRSRSEYAQVLETGPISPLGIKVFRLPGILGAGTTRSFRAEWERLAFLTDRVENALYPITVELRSADALVVQLRSAVVFVMDAIKAPLNVSASFVLDAPLRMRPDGALLDDGIEELIAPGGRLDAVVTALEETPVAATLVVSPVLLEVLQDMQDGYGVVVGATVEARTADDPGAFAAGRLLDRLREVAGRTTTTEVVALPYASPSVPALVEAGLDDDLATQIERGRQVVAALLGVQPSQTVFRPPGSTLTSDSLDGLADVLAADGTTEALLVDAEVLPPAAGLTLTPHGAAPVAAGDSTLTAIAPDPVVEQRIDVATPDPTLRAMWTLGELSAIYFERPSIDRGAALVFAEGEDTPGAFLKALFRGLDAPQDVRWLRPVTATRIAVGQPPQDDPAGSRELEDPGRPPGFSPAVLATLADAHEDLSALASMADQPALLDQLRRHLLLSESRYLAGDEAARLSLVRAVREAVDAEFGKIRPPDPSSITLTSQGGIIPVTLRNDAGYPVRVELRLRSSRLRFVGGASREVVLERPVEQFSFPVRAQTTGRFPVRVELETPDGAAIGSSRIVVRSTAYNRVALVITAGAALFLALWWGRRLLSRRKA